jgi:hypothetical protein
MMPAFFLLFVDAEWELDLEPGFELPAHPSLLPFSFCSIQSSATLIEAFTHLVFGHGV